VQERVLVAVTPRPVGAKLIRRAFRLARRMNGRFWALYVRSPGIALSAKEEQVLKELSLLALGLGGQFEELAGSDPGAEIISFAREHQITFIVMGQSARTRVDEVLRGSIVNRIMRETRNIDIVVVSDPERGAQADETAGENR
jgi:two-component system sensor histidine kinase KdpD